jgi:hypothetical protein
VYTTASPCFPFKLKVINGKQENKKINIMKRKNKLTYPTESKLTAVYTTG